MAPVPAMRRLLKAKRLIYFGAARLLSFPVIIVMIRMEDICPMMSSDMPWLMIVVAGLIGITNGVFTNLAMMRAHNLVREGDHDCAAQIMVFAIFAGITIGSISGTAMHSIF